VVDAARRALWKFDSNSRTPAGFLASLPIGLRAHFTGNFHFSTAPISPLSSQFSEQKDSFEKKINRAPRRMAHPPNANLANALRRLARAPRD
jgi:hypothetical protein